MKTIYGIAGKLYRIVRPVRASHYLAFIRRHGCVGCRSWNRHVDAMHTGSRGMGQKASDFDALPGCRKCHRELHEMGAWGFQDKHKIEFATLIPQFQELYRIDFEERYQELVAGQEAA